MEFLRAGTRRVALGLALSANALLAACGGGTQVEKFVPTRLIAFGDEASAYEPLADTDPNAGNRYKYTVNAPRDTDPATADCATYPNWVQYLASNRGLVMQECNQGRVETGSRSLAFKGAGVADLDGQIAALGGLSNLGETDLVTVYLGTNDIVEQFETIGTIGLDQAKANVEALADRLAERVNVIVQSGAKVLLLTVPDLNLRPYGLKAEAARPGSGEQLRQLSDRFNTRLGFNIVQDGHLIALLKANDELRTLRLNVGFNGLANVTDPVCDPAKYTGDLTNCFATGDAATTDLVTDGTTNGWLFADDLNYSPAGHSLLGLAAARQVERNPL